MNPRSIAFRNLFEQGPFICMGTHDAVTAKLAEECGWERMTTFMLPACTAAIPHLVTPFDESTGSSARTTCCGGSAGSAPRPRAFQPSSSG